MDEREARRRRIKERGTDRLALITGRLQTLASYTGPSSSSSLTTSNSINYFQSDPDPLRGSTLPETTNVQHKTDGDLQVKPILAQTPSSKFSRGNAFKHRKDPDLPLPKGDKKVGTISSPIAGLKNRKQPPTVPAKVSKNSSSYKEAFGKMVKEINSCIVATEVTRVFCSAVIALLVVVLSVNLPSSIVIFTSTIASRPLHILLLSDTTIVVLKMLRKRRDLEKLKVENKLAERNLLGAALIVEIGLVSYQTIRALLIDVSCYTAVIICGLWTVSVRFEYKNVIGADALA